MGSISHHITPLVIDSLGGGHTHKQTYRSSRTEAILRNQARAWFKNFSGAYIGIFGKACCTVDNLVSALSYMYISLMFILIRNKSR